MASTTSSIIIPVRNRWALTGRCLEVVLGTSVGEVIVVDDGSTDNTTDQLREYGDRILVLTQPSSPGFAAACNRGAAAASGEYLVFLNNDTLPAQSWLEALMGYARAHAAAAVVGAKLLYPDGSTQHAGVVIGHDRLPRHLYAGFPSDFPGVNRSRRFQAATAACMLVRRGAFEQAGGFDTAFRNGYEDVDFCLRLGAMGHEVHYCHESVVEHLESVSPARHAHDLENRRLFLNRWAARVRPDDLDYYQEDGLLRVSYGRAYPLRMEVSPLLATIDRDSREEEVYRWLEVRARQVHDLLRDLARLTAEWAEAQLGLAAGSRNPEDANIVGPEGLARDERHARMLQRDAEVRRLLGEQLADLAVASSSAGPFLGYQRIVQHVRETVRRVAQRGATVAVVSSGDDRLTELEGFRAWHFPDDGTGVYAGYHPADSAEAMLHLDRVRERGASYLVFPATAFWWLDTYPEFRMHLETQGQRAWHDVECEIYKLSASPDSIPSEDPCPSRS
jgi:GT2 family glycosyltransferase